jgi:hypothetical protein
VPYNLWFEHTIDAFLRACAEGRDWRAAVAEAEAAIGNAPRKVLTQRDLRAKGIHFSRQHIGRKVDDGTFPPPFQMPFKPKPRELAANEPQECAARPPWGRP